MPEPTPGTPVADDLDQRVELLLRQMEGAAEKAAGIAAADAAPPATAAASAARAGEAELASQVDQLLAQAALAAGDSGATGAPKTIGTLDDELARLASELIEGDYQAEACAPPRGPAAVASNDPASSPAAVDSAPGDTPPIRLAAPGLPVAMPSAGGQGPAPQPRIVASAAASAGAAVGVVGGYIPALAAAVEPALFRIASLISIPLRSRPALVRDAVGWVALGTAFWASCLFVYFIFIDQPAPPVPASARAGLIEPARPASKSETPEAGQEKDAPAPEASKEEGGKSAKSEARKSALKRPEKSPLNRPAPRAAEKKAGEGGEAGGE